jgi:hypothetical protein
MHLLSFGAEDHSNMPSSSSRVGITAGITVSSQSSAPNKRGIGDHADGKSALFNGEE